MLYCKHADNCAELEKTGRDYRDYFSNTSKHTARNASENLCGLQARRRACSLAVQFSKATQQLLRSRQRIQRNGSIWRFAVPYSTMQYSNLQRKIVPRHTANLAKYSHTILANVTHYFAPYCIMQYSTALKTDFIVPHDTVQTSTAHEGQDHITTIEYTYNELHSLSNTTRALVPM